MTAQRLFLTVAGAYFCLSCPVLGEEAEGFAALTSLGKNAKISIGGEIMIDYTARIAETSPPREGKSRIAEANLSLETANLRLRAEMAPDVKAVFKIDMTGGGEPGCREVILEEAKIVMEAIGGSNWSLMAGKGRVPYGQDRTLGIIQSYHHSANRFDGPGGRIFIVAPPGKRLGLTALPPARPGQVEGAVMAAVSYNWQNRWQAEAAIFQTGDDDWRRPFPLSGTRFGWRPEEVETKQSAAGRLWWSPVEGLTLEASGMVVRPAGAGVFRSSPPYRSPGRTYAWAFSAGFDWRRGPWSLFGEYQHGWNWNFTQDYETDTFQLGVTREWRERIRLGVMGERLIISSPLDFGRREDYSRLVLNLRLAMSGNSFAMLEYGREWFSGGNAMQPAEHRVGVMYGIRLGRVF